MAIFRPIALLAVLCLAIGCQQRSRGPASAEAEQLMKNAPPTVAEEPPPPSSEAVPAPEPSPSQPKVEAPVPTPVPAPVPATVPATTRATAATTTVAPTRTPTTLVTRGTRIHVAADADDAARLRNWPVSVVYYSSGNTVAGPVYRFIPAEPKTNNWWDAVLLHESATTALTVPQFIATPIWMLFTSPWKKIEYHGEEVPPSYTVDEKVPYYTNEKVPGIWVVGK